MMEKSCPKNSKNAKTISKVCDCRMCFDVFIDLIWSLSKIIFIFYQQELFPGQMSHCRASSKASRRVHNIGEGLLEQGGSKGRCWRSGTVTCPREVNGIFGYEKLDK